MFSRTVHGGLSALAIFALAGATLRCSSERTEFETPEDAGPQAPLVTPAPDASGDGESPEPEECGGTEIKQIFVLSRAPDAVYRFDPETLTFTLLGYLDCPVSSTFSMAIDRRGVAWILFSGGTLVNVRLDTMKCTEVVLNSISAQPPPLFGMAFAADDSPARESLYLIRDSLYRVDPTTRDTTRVGTTSLIGSAELTGAGNGQLYGYVTESGLIAQLDTTTAKSLTTYRTSVLDQGHLAVAQWGGDFWLFTGARTSGVVIDTVNRFSPATGETKLVLNDTGIKVVGAGSSTCAPFKPVQ
jgi:hypothetical protein